MAITWTVTSVTQKWNLEGTLTSGLTLDINNAAGGSVPTGSTLYSSTTYSGGSYVKTAEYIAQITSSSNRNKMLLSTVGDSGDITYQIAYPDAGSFGAFGAESNVVGETDIRISASSFKFKLNYHSSNWGDLDSFAGSLTNYYLIARVGETATAGDTNHNFQFVGNGDWLPRSGIELDLTTGSLDLGTDTVRWQDVHVQNLDLSGGLFGKIDTLHMISQIEVSAAAQRIEFTGLEGKRFYQMFLKIVGGGIARYYMSFNGDSSASYGYESLRSAGGTTDAGQGWSVSSVTIGANLTSGSYMTGEILIGAGTGREKMFIADIQEGASGQYISQNRVISSVWNNTNTLTSIQITSDTTTGIGVNSVISLWARG